MAQISSNKCETCTDKIGTKFCKDCQEYICDTCRSYHDKFKKGHTVTDAHSASKSVIKSKLFCERHDLGFLHFCDDCKCLTCLKCTTSEHKGHAFTDIAEETATTRDILLELCKDLKSKSSILSDMIKQVKSKLLKKIQEDTKNFKAAAQETCDNFESVVKQVTEFSMTHANDYLEIEEQGLKFTLAQLQNLNDDCKTESAKIEQLLQEKHDLTFYIQQKDLKQNVEALDEIPKIIEPREIGNFDKDKLADDIFERIQYEYKLRVLKDKDDQLEQFNADLQDEKKNAIKQKDLADTEMANILKENEVLATQLKAERQTLGEMQASHDKVLKDKDDQLEQFNADLQDEKTNATKQKDLAYTEMANILKEKEVLATQLKAERQTLCEMQASHDKFSKEKEEQVKQLQKALRDEREQASNQKYQSNKNLQDKEGEIEKLKRELHDAREIASKQKGVLDNEISKVRQENKLLATELKAERQQLGEMQASYAKYSNILNIPKDTTRLRIALIGGKEAGKSSLGNTLLGEKRFKVSIGDGTIQCETQESTLASGRKIKVVDMPGFFDTRGTDVKREVTKAIVALSPGPHAFLIVLQPGRRTEEETHAVQGLTGLLGDANFLKHTIIIMTRKTDITDESGEPIDIHDYIRRYASDDVKDLYAQCGRRIVAVENKYSTRSEKQQYAQEIIDEVLRMGAYYQHGYFKYTTENKLKEQGQKLETAHLERAIEKFSRQQHQQELCTLL